MRIYNQIFLVNFYRNKKLQYIYLDWHFYLVIFPIIWRVSRILANGIFAICHPLSQEIAKLISEN